MTTLIRFFSFEAIENCVTCLNYKIDRVWFFGYQEHIDQKRKGVEEFLKKSCHTDSYFVAIDDESLSDIQSRAEEIVKEGNCYIDITGCTGTCLVAFVNIAYEKNVPMHIYDVYKRKTYYIDSEIKGSISDVEERKVDIRINDYIKLNGGSIRFEKNKRHKFYISEKKNRDLNAIIRSYGNEWNYYVLLLQRMNYDKDSLDAACDDVNALIEKGGLPINSERFLTFLKQLEEASLIRELNTDGRQVRFSYFGYNVRYYLNDAGAILEDIVYRKEKNTADDCMISVNLDWDGIVESQSDKDVLNEVDVMTLNGYLLTFISCKNTMKVRKEDFYELKTIAIRFGGRYARMKLATTAEVSNIEKERARSMGVLIEQY